MARRRVGPRSGLPSRRARRARSVRGSHRRASPRPSSTRSRSSGRTTPGTEDDVFPPLSPDIKRIPADNVDEFNQDDVAEAIKNHLGVNLNVFDKDGYSTHEEEEGNKWKLKLLHNDPPVFQIDNFFTEDECQSYMSMVDPQSKHDDQQQQSNAVQMTSPTFSSLSISRRTSTTWFCRYKSVTTLLAKAQRLLNNVKLNQFEEPQVVRYRTGEEFSWHYDEIPKTSQLSNGGQRLATLLVYLNDLEEDRGGGTVFRDLTPPTADAAAAGSSENKGKKSKRSKGNNTTSNNNDSNNNKQHLTVRPRTGTALLFFPSYTDGTPDQRTLHKGEVALDTKMIAQLWIHENEYQAGVPEGNLQSDAVDGVEREAARLGFI